MTELPLTPDADPPPATTDAATTVLWYHERTKHHLHTYARSPDSLAWGTQPDPFRTFSGAPAVPLPLVGDSLTPTYADLYRLGGVAPLLEQHFVPQRAISSFWNTHVITDHYEALQAMPQRPGGCPVAHPCRYDAGWP